MKPNPRIATEIEEEIKDIKQTVNAYLKTYAEAIPQVDIKNCIAGLVALTNATRLTKVALPSLGEFNPIHKVE